MMEAEVAEEKESTKKKTKIMPVVGRIFLHGTWGFIQSTAGFILFLRYIKCPHHFYNGVIRTAWPGNGGISLGMFIFTPAEPSSAESSPPGGAAGKKKRAVRNRENEDAETTRRWEYCDEVAVHEFGHTFQSLILGPFYLLVVGIPSFVWANLPPITKLRSKKNMPYTWLFCEKWASLWGEKITKERAIR